MSALVISWLFSSLGWLKKAIEMMVDLAARYPWQAGCAALLACSALLWRGEHKAAEQRDAARATIARMKDASTKAGQLAEAQRKADEQHYKELADDADTRHQQDTARVDRATADYLTLHRLRVAAAAGPGSEAGAQAQSGGADIPADPASGAVVVAVSEADVKTCAGDYSYAKAAYDWAMSLED